MLVVVLVLRRRHRDGEGLGVTNTVKLGFRVGEDEGWRMAAGTAVSRGCGSVCWKMMQRVIILRSARELALRVFVRRGAILDSLGAKGSTRYRGW